MADLGATVTAVQLTPTVGRSTFANISSPTNKVWPAGTSRSTQVPGGFAPRATTADSATPTQSANAAQTLESPGTIRRDTGIYPNQRGRTRWPKAK